MCNNETRIERTKQNMHWLHLLLRPFAAKYFPLKDTSAEYTLTVTAAMSALTCVTLNNNALPQIVNDYSTENLLYDILPTVRDHHSHKCHHVNHCLALSQPPSCRYNHGTLPSSQMMEMMPRRPLRSMIWILTKHCEQWYSHGGGGGLAFAETDLGRNLNLAVNAIYGHNIYLGG